MDFDVVKRRLARLRALMQEKKADAFVLLVLERLNSENCHYISGFRGSSAALIIDGEEARLITDGRYRTQAAEQSPFSLTVQADLPLPAYVAKTVTEKGWRTVAFEAEKVSHGLFEAVLRPAPTRWVDGSAFIPSLRRSKDDTEAGAIRAAAAIARRAYDLALERVKPGMTEVEFESLALSEIKRWGGEKGWAHDDFIVAVKESDNIADKDVSGRSKNVIIMMHTHDFESPSSHNFKASIKVGAEKDNNMTPAPIAGENAWRKGKYYILVKTKDAKKNSAISKRYPIVLN